MSCNSCRFAPLASVRTIARASKPLIPLEFTSRLSISACAPATVKFSRFATSWLKVSASTRKPPGKPFPIVAANVLKASTAAPNTFPPTLRVSLSALTSSVLTSGSFARSTMNSTALLGSSKDAGTLLRDRLGTAGEVTLHHYLSCSSLLNSLTHASNRPFTL